MNPFHIFWCVIFVTQLNVTCCETPTYLPGDTSQLPEHRIYRKHPPFDYNCSAEPNFISDRPDPLTFYGGDGNSLIDIQCDVTKPDWVFWKESSEAGEILNNMPPTFEIDVDGTEGAKPRFQWSRIGVSGFLACCNVSNHSYNCGCKLDIQFELNGKDETTKFATFPSTEFGSTPTSAIGKSVHSTTAGPVKLSCIALTIISCIIVAISAIVIAAVLFRYWRKLNTEQEAPTNTAEEARAKTTVEGEDLLSN